MAQEPDEGMRMRGSTGTDAAQHYVDDGLQQSLDGLHRAQLALQKDVADMAGRLVFREGALVTAVRAGHWVILDELNLAPSEVLEALNRCCYSSCCHNAMMFCIVCITVVCAPCR